MPKEENQLKLLEAGESWEEHWKGMPEFVQNDLTPFKSIMVHFESRKDMEAFSKLTGQKVTTESKCIWYPETEIGRMAGRSYSAEGSVLYADRRRPK